MNKTALHTDTICAIATPMGRGGIGVVRLSGPKAVLVSKQLMSGHFPVSRRASYRDFLDINGETLDQGIILFFKGPHSFTGEDVVEFQGHGSPVILQELLDNACTQGARLARPGEFSERAFLNGRLDLTQAEAVADLIHASSEHAARAAIRSLQGVFSEKVNLINQQLISIRTMVETAIDFSEEAIDTLSTSALEKQLKEAIHALELLRIEAGHGQRLQEGMQLAIIGPPNAGKSSLLNALSGQDIAIVHEISGTTRDILRTDVDIGGLLIHVVDTAGLHTTENAVEKEGIRRALATIKQADQIVWLVDSTRNDPGPSEVLASFDQPNVNVPIAIVRNKIDLSGEKVGIIHGEYDVIRLSAKTRQGLCEFKAYLKQKVGYDQKEVGFSARARHTEALKRAERHLREGLRVFQSDKALEVLAVYLNETHRLVGEIVGLFTTEDLLGEIFSKFCIGK